MLRIVKNSIVDHFRKVKSSKTDLFSSFDSVKINEECYDYGIDEKVALIKKLSNNLTIKYKLVFDMFAVEGYEHSEIAKELSINRGTSRSNFFKAKNKIKTQFELEYFRK
jgi:RNA polymerase sigma-70 factor (ECF subfamily)